MIRYYLFEVATTVHRRRLLYHENVLNQHHNNRIIIKSIIIHHMIVRSRSYFNNNYTTISKLSFPFISRKLLLLLLPTSSYIQRQIYYKSTYSRYNINADNHEFVPKSSQQRQQQQLLLLLPPPTILYQNNHLLVVNKPPGWYSIPNQSSSSSSSMDDQYHDQANLNTTITTTASTNTTNNMTTTKCLYTYLSTICLLGGGSHRTYIKPIHRIDQPCSGIMIYCKTTKAAQRLQQYIFQKQQQQKQTQLPSVGYDPNVQINDHTTKDHIPIYKVYYAMIYQNNHQHHMNSNNGNNMWHTLHGIMKQPSMSKVTTSAKKQEYKSTGSTNNHKHNNKGWSVTMEPIIVDDQSATLPPFNNDNQHCTNRRHSDTTTSNKRKTERYCTLQYRYVDTYQQQQQKYQLLQVITNQGTRHMIRALLSCHDMYIVGDVRYYRHDTTKTTTTTPTTIRTTTSCTPKIPLPDQSVALHAYRMQFPKHILHKEYKKQYQQRHNLNDIKGVDNHRLNNENATIDNNNNNKYNNGSDIDAYDFIAPIPTTWDEYFHCPLSIITEFECKNPI